MGSTYFFIDSQYAADIADDEGLEFDTFDDACEEADRALREIALSTRVKTLTLSVFDENRQLVHRARLDVTQEAGNDC